MIEFLDPRHDPRPSYWAELAESTGRPEAWEWELLRLSAWHRRSPLLLAVVHEGGRPRGVLGAVLRGTSWRRGRFAAPAGLPAAGFLDTTLPIGTALPAWWLEPAGRSERAALLAEFRRGVRRELGVRCRGVLWREIGPPEPLPGPVRLARRLNPVARLALPWRDREGWLDSLAPSRAADLRRQLRRVAADPSVATEVGPAAALVGTAEIAALKRENELKYGRPAPLPNAYLAELTGRDGTVAITFRGRDGLLLAFGLLLDHPSWPLFHMWGAVPPERGGRRHLYFAAYAEAVGWAVAARKDGLILGKGKTALKGELGATFLPCRMVAVPS